MSASKFTPETQGALTERTAAGVSLSDACRAVGVREATVKGWISRGRREPGGEYGKFVEALEEARAVARARPGPMDADELAQVVSNMARAGSVQAARLRWEMLRTEGGDEDSGPADEFDELKARRARGGG